MLSPFLKVRYEGDLEGALVQFSSPAEAKKAHDNTEAVLNNRFIKIYYLKKDNSLPPPPPPRPSTLEVNSHFLILELNRRSIRHVTAQDIKGKEVKVLLHGWSHNCRFKSVTVVKSCYLLPKHNSSGQVVPRFITVWCHH